MQTFGRDYTLSAAETRQLEVGALAPQVNGDTLLGWADYQRGGIAVIFATLFAAPLRRRAGEWDKNCYADMNQAHDLYRSQLDLYRRLVEEHADKFHMVTTVAGLNEVMDEWHKAEGESKPPVGLVILMEGAEGVRSPGELSEWWEGGVRLIGPAWAGTRFCGGTREPGELTREGYALLEAMSEYGFALDLSHMDEKAALQALDFYTGRIVATHANALSLLKDSHSNRHLSDRVIKGIIERDGVIGVVLANVFLQVGWKRGDARQLVTLDHVVAQIDYICQLAGDAKHVGIGTDFDGGFGLQSVPYEFDTIADLRKLEVRLSDKGYTPSDIDAIMGENWLTCLKQTLPVK
jgi:membrane dipeptidase